MYFTDNYSFNGLALLCHITDNMKLMHQSLMGELLHWRGLGGMPSCTGSASLYPM